MRLSPRLSQLAEMAQGYDQYWDICCDHGLLSKKLAQDHPNSEVIALDILPHLERVYFNKHFQDNFRFCCRDARVFDFSQDAKGKILFIIAGVGAHLALDIIENLKSLIDTKDCSLLLCIHQKSYLVREALSDFSLDCEYWVQDSGKEYDLFLCKKKHELGKNGLTLFNQKMSENEKRKLLEYFQIKYENEKDILEKRRYLHLFKNLNIFQSVSC